MKTVTKFMLPIGIFAIGIASMFLLFSFKTDSVKRHAKPRPKIVETEVVKLQDISTMIPAFGRLISSQPVDIISEATGTIIAGNIPFLPAQSFKKGNLLLKIDDRQTKLSIDSKKSELLSALANVLPEIKSQFPDKYPVWQDYFDKINFDQNLEPLPPSGNQKIKLYLARFNVYKLFFAVRDLEIKLEKHYIYAPFSGSIVSADMRAGSTARLGTKLGRIVNIEKLEVEVPVPAEDIHWLKRKDTVFFSSSDFPRTLRGVINRIGSVIDERTQTVPVFISVESDQNDQLYEGIFLKAEIPGNTVKNAFMVPRHSIYNDTYVYLLLNGQLELREINIARQENDMVIINQGLENSDTLVVEVMQGVMPGMPAISRGSEIETQEL